MHESDVQTAITRLNEVDLDVEQRGTIAVDGRAASVRELPRISVDLHSTLAGKLHGDRSATPRVDRDLEVISLLGEGGMGRVLLARQHSLDREVAIKTLHAAASDRERAALISEGAITGFLEHPTIIPVHALGLDGDGRPVLIMKRVEGVTWTELLANPTHEAWGAADGEQDRLAAHLGILMQVCNAVHFAHSRSIVHRDIKPHNVLLGRHGEVYLCDWGLALNTDREWITEPLCGTPGYMAPEMVLGHPVDARTDVYLLGATLHHVLTGRPRHGGADARAALLGTVVSTPATYAETVPHELAALVDHATQRDPDARPASAKEFQQALADYLKHRSSIALARSARERLDELRQSIHAGRLGDEASQSAIERLTIEARYALQQAIAQWSDNLVAKQAQDELEALLAARRARAAELERLARDLDPTISGPQRTAVFLALALVGIGLSVAALASGSRLPSPRSLLMQSFAPLAALCTTIVLLRRHVLASAINRRMAASTIALVGGVSLSRSLALAAGLSASQMLLGDCMLMTVGLAVCATYGFAWFAWSALFMFAAAIAAAVDPARAMLAFSLGTGLSLIVCAALLWRSSNRRADG